VAHTSTADDMPQLIPQAPARPRADNNNNTNNTNNTNNSNNNTNSANNNAPSNNAPIVNIEDVDDSSTDDSMPGIAPRGDLSDDDMSSDGSMPALLPRNANDDLSSSDSEMPDLLGDQNGSSSEDSDDDFDDDLISEADSDNSSLPELRPRHDSDDLDDDSSVNSDLPPLEPKNNDSDDSSAGSYDSMPPLRAAPPPAPTTARAPPVPSEEATTLREIRLKEEIEKAKKLRPSQLKRKLEEFGIPSNQFVEKFELVEAYANAVVDREPSSSSRPAPPPAPPVPVDPMASLPALVPAKDPPKGGVWVCSPEGTFSCLHYVFLQDGQIHSRPFGRYSTGCALVPRIDSGTFVYAPSANNSSVWEIFCVKEMNLVVKLYDDFSPNAEMVTDGHEGVWALRPIVGSSTESQWNLVHVNALHPSGKTVKSNIPLSSRLILSLTNGVWLNVGREGANSSTMQPGIWYVTHNESRRVVVEVNKTSFITSDGAMKGLWILEATETSDSLLLTHVNDSGDKQTQEIDADISCVLSMVSTANDLYIHYKNNERWKLCSIALGRRFVKEVSDCPRNSQISSHGVGVWMWKKIGRAAERSLLYLDKNGKLHEHAQRFPGEALFGA
jgi:hypothetical protein